MLVDREGDDGGGAWGSGLQGGVEFADGFFAFESGRSGRGEEVGQWLFPTYGRSMGAHLGVVCSIDAEAPKENEKMIAGASWYGAWP